MKKLSTKKVLRKVKKYRRAVVKTLSGLTIFNVILTPLFIAGVFISPNMALAADTGFLAPTDNTTGSGVAAWATPTKGHVSDNVYATANGNSKWVSYKTFNIPAISAGSTIDGIEVSIEGKTAGRQANVDLSWNTGTNYTTGTGTTLTSTEGTIFLGGSTDKWGTSHTWAVGDFTNANFRVRLISTGSSGTISVDQVRVKVYYTPDTTSPTVSSINLGGPSPTNDSPVTWTVTFSESVTGVNKADFLLVPTGLGGTPAIPTTGGVSGSGATYTVTASTGSGSGTLGLNLVDDDSIIDVAGNKLGGTGTGNGNFTGQVYTIDRTAPTVTINQAEGQADSTDVSPINFTVVFSEPVTDFINTDVTISGTEPGAKTTTVTGSGTTYNVAVSGMTAYGTVIATIASGKATDTAGNANTVSTSADNTVTFDNGWEAPAANNNGGGTIWATPTKGHVSDNVYATANVTPRKVSYATFNIPAIPAGSTIDGIEVSIEGLTTGRQANVDLSWDNGTNYTTGSGTSVQATTLTGTEQTIFLGGSTDKWGTSHTWVVGDFTANFRVRLVSTGSSGTISVDQVRVKVYYTLPSSLAVTAASGTYGDTAGLTATLTSDGSGVSGKTIDFTLNGVSVGSAQTNASGVATFDASLNGISVGSYLDGVGASFAGDTSYGESSGTEDLTITPESLTITANDENKFVGQILTLLGTEFTTSELVDGDSVESVTLSSDGLGAEAPADTYSIVPSNALGAGLGNYLISYFNGTLTVNEKLNPSITWPDPSDITYGTPLGGEQLNATADVPGDFIYTPAEGTILNAGSNQDLEVEFIPADTDTYNNASAYAKINVLKANIAVTANDQSKTYGDSFTFDGTEFTPDGLLYGSDHVDSVTLASDGAAASAPAFDSPYAIVASDAVGAGLDNYDIVYNMGSLVVNKAPLTVTPDDKEKFQGTVFSSFTGPIFGLKNSDIITASYASDGASADAAVGEYDITATPNDPDLRLGNYEVTLNIGTLVVRAHVITASTGDNGSISPSGEANVVNGANQTFTIAPDIGYHVADVLVDGESVGAVESYEFTGVIADHTISASFAIDTHTLTYTAGDNGSMDGISLQTVDYGADGTAVTALPDTGYHFVDWSDASTDNPRTDTNVQADKDISANFAIDTHALTYTAGVNGSITGDSPQTVDYGANGAEVTAVPDEGYYFTGWSDDSTDNPRTDANITADVSFAANFAEITLQSIAITTLATKLSYTVSDSLDTTGLVVTGTYNNASTVVVTPVEVTGFNSSVPAAGQVLTVTYGGKTTTYTVDIVAMKAGAAFFSLFSGGNNNGGGGNAPVNNSPLSVTATIGANQGGSASLPGADGSNITVSVPAGATSQGLVLSVTTGGLQTPQQNNLASHGLIMVGNKVYSITATSDGQSVTSFDRSLTITINYSDSQIGGLDEGSLEAFWWDPTANVWVSMGGQVNQGNNQLTFTTNHLSTYSLAGAKAKTVIEKITGLIKGAEISLFGEKPALTEKTVFAGLEVLRPQIGEAAQTDNSGSSLNVQAQPASSVSQAGEPVSPINLSASVTTFLGLSKTKTAIVVIILIAVLVVLYLAVRRRNRR